MTGGVGAKAVGRAGDGDRVWVGALASLPLGRFTVVDVGGVEVGLLRTERDVVAVRNHCPHRGAPICRGEVGGTMLPSEPGTVRYGMEAEVVSCPWHGYEFELRTGLPLFGGTRGRLQCFPCGVEDGEVWIERRRRRRRGEEEATE